MAEYLHEIITVDITATNNGVPDMGIGFVAVVQSGIDTVCSFGTTT